MRGKTQVELLLEYLQRYGSITCKEAFELLNIGNVSSTIAKVRQLGYKIQAVTEKDCKQNTKYLRYYMFSTEPEKPKRKSKPPKKEKVVRKDRTPKALKCEHKDSRMWKRG